MIVAHNNTNNITSNDTRQRFVSAILDGGDPVLVGTIFHVKPWTV